jgi:gamma-glutamylcyclotransferase (GGCT)/AIG2-like uncharacterized protein YtfP
MNQRIFVYGTLKMGHYFHNDYLGDGKSVARGQAQTTRDYSLYVDAAPHMIRESSETGVKGELYEVNGDVLKTLDELWAHPVVYFRDIIEVIDEKGDTILAWAYLRPTHFKGKKYCEQEQSFE